MRRGKSTCKGPERSRNKWARTEKGKAVENKAGGQSTLCHSKRSELWWALRAAQIINKKTTVSPENTPFFLNSSLSQHRSLWSQNTQGFLPTSKQEILQWKPAGHPLIQFNFDYLPGDSVWSHRLRTQSSRLSSTSVTSSKPRSLKFLTNRLQTRILTTFSPPWGWLICHSASETSGIHVQLPLYYKGYLKGYRWRDDAHGKGHGAPMSSQGITPSRNLNVQLPGSSPNAVLLDFYGDFTA